MEDQKSKNNSCCHFEEKVCDKSEKSWLFGLIYGILPHSFCIAFVVFAFLGSVTMTSFVGKFLLIQNFFYILVLISLIFATISAIIYLRKQNCFCLSGIRKKWKYLSILFFVTIFSNLFIFKIIMPVLAKVEIETENKEVLANNDFSEILISVEIPCAGHSFLIIDEINKNFKDVFVKFQEPNEFLIKYDKKSLNKEDILNLEVFKTYKATIVQEDLNFSFLKN